MYQLLIEQKAKKFLSKLNPKSYRLASETIRKLGYFHEVKNLDLKSLKGKFTGMMRLRVGTRRILFIVDETKKEIRIWIIEDRGDIY